MHNSVSINSDLEDNVVLSLKTVNSKLLEDMKKYNSNNKVHKKNIESLYRMLGGLTPNNDINDILYFEDYIEKGVIVEGKISNLVNTWNNYRMIYNKKTSSDVVKEGSYVLDNFDELFNKLSMKINGIDKYISDLNDMKKEVKDNTLNLEYSKETLELEKAGFENYYKIQNEKLDKREKEIEEKMEKVNKLMDELNSKMDSLYKDNKKKP